jgi:hypothetical protein
MSRIKGSKNPNAGRKKGAHNSNAPYVKEKILELLGEGKTITNVMELTRISYPTYKGYCKHDPEFEKACNDLIYKVRESIMHSAERGLKDCVDAKEGWAIKLALTNLGKQWYSDRQEIDLNVTGEIKFKFGNVLDKDDNDIKTTE